MVCAPRKDFEIETAREDIVSRTNRQRFVRDLNTDPITRMTAMRMIRGR
jgi:hypothetical protein